MKIKIPIKYHNKECKIETHGCWIDLKSAENVRLGSYGESKLISLGVSMRLPKYFQANIVPRSSTFNRYGLIQGNHYGVIDGPSDKSDGYSGNDDIWKFNGVYLPNTDRVKFIEIGDRICQFEIKPSMFAPWWVKLKWLFMTDIIFVEVDDLKSKNRGGFGSTGK
jgi:dUTP pyrophosphatase